MKAQPFGRGRCSPFAAGELTVRARGTAGTTDSIARARTRRAVAEVHHVHLVDAQVGVRLQVLDEGRGVRLAVPEDGLPDLAGSRPTSAQCCRSTSSLCATRSSPAPGEEVAGVGVLRDEAQRLLLARMPPIMIGTRPAAAGGAQRLLELVVLAVVRPVVVGPHLPHDLQRLLDPLEPLLQRRERDAEAAVLLLVPGGPEPEHRSPAGEDVEGGHDLGQQAGVPVGDAGHHQLQLDASRCARRGTRAWCSPRASGPRAAPR